MEYTGLTLGEFLSNDEFRDYKVLCGKKGLCRTVNSATVMDAVDIENWIRGGEIVMTSGYIWKNSPKDFLKMIEKINSMGATALFIKLGRFIDRLSPDVYELSEKLDFPIVKMPVERLFLEVTEPVLTRIIDRQAVELRHSQEIHNSFINIVTKGGGVQEIIETLAILCGKEIAFYDAILDRISTSSYVEDIESLRENYRQMYECRPVNMDGKFLGSIINLSQTPFGQYDIVAAEHASTVLNLVQQKSISKIQIEKQYRMNFVQDMIIRNIKTREEVFRRGKVFGWDLKKEGYLCVIVDIDDFKKQYLKMNTITDSKKINFSIEQIFSFTQQMITEYYSDAMFTFLSDSLTAIIPADEEGDKSDFLMKMLQEIRLKIQNETQFTATIVVGCVQKDIMNIYKSYQQAQKCIKISRRVFQRNHLMYFQDLGIYLFLDSFQQTDDTKQLCRQTIEPLLLYDKEHRTQMMETLVTIIDENWNLKQTSEKMFLHYNTLKKRFIKIQEILGKDLSDTSQRIIIELIIRLYELNSLL